MLMHADFGFRRLGELAPTNVRRLRFLRGVSRLLAFGRLRSFLKKRQRAGALQDASASERAKDFRFVSGGLTVLRLIEPRSIQIRALPRFFGAVACPITWLSLNCDRYGTSQFEQMRFAITLSEYDRLAG